MANIYDIVYHCDSRPEIGNGHLKRGLDVLAALRERNPDLKLALCGRYSNSANHFISIFRHPSVDVFHTPSTLPASKLSVLDTMHRAGDPSYLERNHALRVKDSADKFAIVSSALSVELPVVCDLFIDHLPDVAIFGEQPENTHTGFEFAPVSSEFYTHDQGSDDSHSNHLVAVIGGGSVQNGPEIIAKALYDQALDAFSGFAMVVSPHYPGKSRKKMEQDFPWLEILQDVPSIAPLIQSAEAVICTYGNITYESLSCGKATFIASYEDFQNEYASYLERKGMVHNLGLFGSLDRVKQQYIFNPARRSELTTRVLVEFSNPGVEAITDLLLTQLETQPND